MPVRKRPMSGLVSGCCLLAQGGSPAQLIFSSIFVGEPGPCHNLPLLPKSGARVPHGVLPSPCQGSELQEGQSPAAWGSPARGHTGCILAVLALLYLPFVRGCGNKAHAGAQQSFSSWTREGLGLRPHQVLSCYQNLLSGVL